MTEEIRSVVVFERNLELRAKWAERYHRLAPQGKNARDLRTPEVARYWDQVMVPRREAARAWLQSVRLVPRRGAAPAFAVLQLARSREAIRPEDLARAAQFLALRRRLKLIDGRKDDASSPV